MKLSSAKCKLVTAVRLPGQAISKFAPTQHIWKLPAKFRQARKMPEVCRFYGIIIRFYYREHPPTHFHAIYGEHEALIEIETGDVYQGWLPATAYDLVNTWRADTSPGTSSRLGTGSPAPG